MSQKIKIVSRKEPYAPFFAIVDDEDFERLSQYNWWPHKGKNTIYARTTINSKNHYMHKMVFDTIKMIDHVNGIGLDNRKSNLRKATTSQNGANRVGGQTYRGKQTASKFKGLWINQQGTWSVTIMKNRTKFYLGRFDTEEEAARAYDAKAVELFGEFARLNFPKD